MRNRPQLITTVSQDHYDLLAQEKARNPRPMSYVVDEALRVWATAGARMAQLENNIERLQLHVRQLEEHMQVVGEYLDEVDA